MLKNLEFSGWFVAVLSVVFIAAILAVTLGVDVHAATNATPLAWFGAAYLSCQYVGVACWCRFWRCNVTD